MIRDLFSPYLTMYTQIGDLDYLPDTTVVVIGGMSFHGAMIAEYLHKKDYKVILLEDSLNIAPVPLKWDRWSQLTVDKTFFDFSDEAKLKMSLLGAATVLYVPTGLIDMETMTNDPIKQYHLGSLTLAHFQKLLLLISKVPSIDQVILLSTVDKVLNSNLVHKTWLSTLEQLYIHSYHSNVLKTNAALIKVNGVFGPWKETDKSSNNCWYIESVAHLVRNITDTFSPGFVTYDFTTECQKDKEGGSTITTSWNESYTRSLKKKRDVIAGAVLIFKETKAYWPSHVHFNDHKYFRTFLISAMKSAPEADILIIHNTLSDDVVEKLLVACPSCQFKHEDPVNMRISHNQRLYLLYDYLLNNPDIDYLVISDICDVSFFADPFQVMKEIGDYIYTGYDVPFYSDKMETLPWLRRMLTTCFPNLKYAEKNEILNLYGILNSGTLGGSRHILLSLLSRMILYLDIASIYGVCDMLTANVVLHLQQYDHVYPGYPFSGSFLTGIAGQQGVAIWHKRGGDAIIYF
uniref:Uncharacterized protein n=1 Tax=Amphimedon queenslandica TaxID=400682 RepID=A0A1X7SW68_AMPQE